MSFEELQKQCEELPKPPIFGRETSVGYLAITAIGDLNDAFLELNLKDKTFLDLGSGDGRVALLAELHGAKSFGIEGDKELFELSEKLKKDVSWESKAQFIHKDFFQHDLSKYDFIYWFPDRPFFREVEEKLLKELKGKLIIPAFPYRPSKLKLEKDLLGGFFKCYSL